ncbi:MAG: dihydrolipoyl dehydrogenase [Thaumarchaeota archaeon]|nr:dihydrolipoyl dehydrogenase [Nitrososphaerota archaeon]
MVRRVDVVVIGAGPGGYVSAIRLGQLGKKTVLVEKQKLGGVCLNHGCIPSKALISAGRLARKIKDGGEIGLETTGLKIDFTKTQAWKSRVVNRLISGIKLLCERNGVDVVYGEANVEAGKMVKVKNSGATEELQADSIVVATGSRPIELRSFPFDGKLILDSTSVLDLSEVPGRLLVIGGGITGLEIGGMYQDLGAQLTVVELMDQVLPGFDPEVADVVYKSFLKRGAKIYLKADALGFETSTSGVKARLRSADVEVAEEFDKVLVAVGRKPNTSGLGLENIGVELDQRGFIKVDEQMRTTANGIYAIGDVAGPPFLAHKASREGIVAAEVICDLPSAMDNRAMPSAVFTDPEVATVGLTEEEAKRTLGGCVAERFPFQASGRALTQRESNGFVKMVADAQRKRILGVHIVGPDASDLISEAALAIEMGASAEDLALTVHPHPTLPEALMEAAEAIIGAPIHTLKRE